MTDKIDTSPEALRAEAVQLRKVGLLFKTGLTERTIDLLNALADEKAAWAAREADLVRERATDEKRWDRIAEACANWDWSHCTTEKELIEQINFTIQRAEQAEADVAAMRVVLQSIAQKGPCFDAKGTRSKEINDIARAALSSTAGRVLLARMERLQEAVRLADRLIPWGAAKGEWRELKEVEHTLSVQCP